MLKNEKKICRINIDRSKPKKQSKLVPKSKFPCYVIGNRYSTIGRYDGLLYNFHRFILNNEDIIDILSQLEVSLQSPSIIHVHDPALLPFSVKISSYFKNSKIVYDRHEVYETPIRLSSFIPMPEMGRLSELLTAKKVDGVVTILEAYRDNIKKMFPRSKIAVVPNYPVFEEYNDNAIVSKIRELSNETTLHFVYVGSLAWKYDRDIGLILHIAKKLLSGGYDVKFTIGGSIPDEQLMAEFSCLSVTYPDRFSYMGYLSRDRVIEITQNAHFGFLLIKPDTDYWVLGSPNKLYEYARCGVIPIVRAKISRIDQLDECTLWFERDESQEDIMNKIVLMLKDTNKLREMMKKIFRLSPQFSFEMVAPEYLSLYRAVGSDFSYKVND